MVYQPVEQLLPKAEGNVYKLSTIAFRRALELANGQAKLVDAPLNEKLATTALREIIAGKVMLKEVADAEEAEAKAEAAHEKKSKKK